MIKNLKDKVVEYHNDLQYEKDLNEKLRKYDEVANDMFDLPVDDNDNLEEDLLGLDEDIDQLL